MRTALRRRLFFSLLLVLTFPLASCDSGGSNGDDEPQQEDLFGQHRLITSEDPQGNVFDARESDLDYYYREDSDGVDTHICLSDDSIVKARLSTLSTEVNSSGNLVKTEEIVEADDVVLYDEENEGGNNVIEFLEISSDVGETQRWVVKESPEQFEGNTDTARRIEEIPETDEDCANREKFHN
jgi:hypothetical protein